MKNHTRVCGVRRSGENATPARATYDPAARRARYLATGT